jgi:hypothetical protein
MSTNSNSPDVEEPERDRTADKEAAGVEVGSSGGEGSTFEPEEDPEGDAD